MGSLLDDAALMLAAWGVVVLLLSPRSGLSTGIAFMMDLWTASGLLHLSGGQSWSRIGSAAAIILVREMILVRQRA